MSSMHKSRKVQTIPSDVVQVGWMKNPAYRTAYEAAAPAERIAITLLRARVRAKLTQQEVADRMETTQSVVAKLESGRHLPSVASLERYAKALGRRLEVHFR